MRPSSSFPALPLPAPDLEAWRIVAHVRNGATREAGKLVLAHDRVPSPTERRRLQQRLHALNTAVSNHDRRAVGTAIADLLGCYRNAFKAGEDPKPVIAKYVQELAAVPTWCVQRVCDEMRSGAAGDGVATYPPSTIQVKLACEEYLARPRQEIGEIVEVLQAKCAEAPMTDEERDRVAAGMRQLAADLKNRHTETGEDPREVLKRYGASDEQIDALRDAKPTAGARLDAKFRGAA